MGDSEEQADQVVNMRRILSAALLAIVLVTVGMPQIEAIRRQEDRQEEAQRAVAMAEAGVLAGGRPEFKAAIEILAGLDREDPYEFVEHILRAGRQNQPNDFPNDFRVEAGTVSMRTLKLGDIGDPPDIMLGRVGPDGVDFDYDGEWQECPPGQSLGSIYWVGWNPNTQWSERSAQITGRCQGRGKGSLHFFTNGNERFIIHDNGKWEYNGPELHDQTGIYIPITVNGVEKRMRLF